MPLELANYQTREVRFGDETRWRDGVLELDKDRLLEGIRDDPEITRADFEIARPGESVRITTLRDVVEPRIKVGGDAVAYAGILGRPVETAGQGHTNRLGGMALVVCAPRPDLRELGWIGGRRTYLDWADMSGPGALGPYASLHDLCLLLEHDAELGPDDGNRAVQRAMLTVSDRLAETTLGQEPTEIEVFDMTPTPGLPGFVYIHSVVSPEPWVLNPDSTLGTAVYGITRLTQPWLLSPTEVLDGAACGSFLGGWHTWPLTNTTTLHMCRRHGKDFNFLGCIMVRTMWEEQRQKELMGNRAAVLATSLGANGAIITPTLRGQRFLDTMMVVRGCERAGIKTVLITEEEDNEDGNAPPFLVSVPELAAVVSTGDGSAPGPFPPVEKVIGAGPIPLTMYQEQEPPHGRYGTSHLCDGHGFSKLACVDY